MQPCGQQIGASLLTPAMYHQQPRRRCDVRATPPDGVGNPRVRWICPCQWARTILGSLHGFRKRMVRATDSRVITASKTPREEFAERSL
jgi:hypothetical protein